MTRHNTIGGLLALLALMGASPGGALPVASAQETSSLREQVQALSQAQGLVAEGLEHIGDASSLPVSGDLDAQLRVLLAGYSYALWQDARDGERKLKIIGAKGAKAVSGRRLRIKTTRQGAHHVVASTVRGPGSRGQSIALLIDTGATTVVLPASMSQTLGFDEADLEQVALQTANGETTAKRGRLASLQIGNVTETDVEVSFVDDQRMAGSALLGMSFLDRFKFTVDDKKGELVLTSK